MKEKNFKKNKNGITLIALIITIIVMLILVAVTITMAINGGLFDYASRAARETNEEMERERELANWAGDLTYEELIARYTNGGSGGSGSGILTENYVYTDESDEFGRTAVIPAGFRLTSENVIADGLVIEDAAGNQFVWIPVEEGEFERIDWFDWGEEDFAYYTEPDESVDTQTTQDEYQAMVASVAENGGFYIGRYEAGSTTERTSSSVNTDMVIKQDAYPYNYVPWEDNNGKKGAVTLSRELYTENEDYGVTSTLCYGVQWDAVIRFVKDNSHNVTNSTNWGNYMDNPWTINRTTAKYYDEDEGEWEEIESSKTKDNETYYLLTTGASNTFSAKNIYDLAGNVCEWTMEALSSTYRVDRGGFYFYDGSNDPAASRSYDNPINSFNLIGFRVALYL